MKNILDLYDEHDGKVIGEFLKSIEGLEKNPMPAHEKGSKVAESFLAALTGRTK